MLDKVDTSNVFPEHPLISFKPMRSQCICGRTLSVAKTRAKTVATMEIGEFIAHETLLRCKTCATQYDSEELQSLVPHRCKFGFNVIVEIGKALFLRHQNETETQQELRAKNIRISIREIGYLAQKFIVYLALAHKESQGEIKKLLNRNGGYLLHLDSTVEGNSPHLMTALDEIAEIVLGNIKIPSENRDDIIPFLRDVKESYGVPIAITRDMSAAIGSAVEEVFPGVKNFICHYHFLRDIGKDLFGRELRG